MDVLRALFRSRKFVAGLITVIVSVLVALGVPEDLVEPLVTSIVAVGMAYMLGTAYEDGQEKAAPYVEIVDDESDE